MKLGEKWHLICAKWWQKWEKYVGYMNAETSDMDFPPVGLATSEEEEHPGPIVNSHMTIADASLTDGEEPKLKDKLRETFDYEIVHASVWNKLVECKVLATQLVGN